MEKNQNTTTTSRRDDAGDSVGVVDFDDDNNEICTFNTQAPPMSHLLLKLKTHVNGRYGQYLWQGDDGGAVATASIPCGFRGGAGSL